MVKEDKQLPAIVINSQYVKDLSLEIPHAPEIFKELTAAPEVNIEVETGGKALEGNLFESTLSFKLEGKIKGKHLFVLELVYGSIIGLNVPQEHVEPVLMVEIPRLMFPFARSIITNNLVDAGLPPFMLNPIDFAAIYNSKKAVKN